MNLRSAAGGSLARFAHLAGLGRTRAAEDEKDKDKPADDKKDSKAEEDEDEKKPAEDEKKDGKAEEDDKKDSKAEDEEENGEDEEEEKEKPSAAAAARKAERARCAAIFAAPEAAANVQLAAHLAFETDLSVQAAVGTLKAGAAGGSNRHARGGLADRMAGEKSPRLGADGGGGTTPDRDTPEGNAAFILNAGRRPKGGK